LHSVCRSPEAAQDPRLPAQVESFELFMIVGETPSAPRQVKACTHMCMDFRLSKQ
jgi:hypothetical protein